VPRLKAARTALALLALVLLAASPAAAKKAHKVAYKEGVKAMEQRQWDWAVVHLQRAHDLRPSNRDYEASLRRAKFQASYQHFEKAKHHLASGNLESAIAELQQTVTLNPTHQYAYVELEKALEAWKAIQSAQDEKTQDFLDAKRESIRDGAAPPKLDPASDVPIIWDMKDATVEDIFSVVHDVANINVIFDEGVRLDEKTDFNTDNIQLEEALDLLMLKLGLVFKVYNDHTILVYPDNQTKRREYEDQVIQTFYLSNAEVKDVNALLRGVVDIRKTAVNEQLNAITILDTQDKIAIAGRLIERNDKAKAELIIDLEILEVNRTKLKSWGIDITTGEGGGINTTIAFDDDQLRLNNLRRLRQQGSWILSPIPSAVISLVKNDTDTRTLSRPQARVTDGEKVTVHIGDQVPIPNTTFNTSNNSGGNIVPVTSFTYQNVGIQIVLEPRVHHNREITLKMQTEISAVTSVSAAGQPTIGSREIETVIRLRDGETNLLAGLFSETRQNSDGGIPGVMDVPWFKKIFGTHQRQSQEAEIILTVTPHIIRIPDIGREDLGPLAVGTDKNRRLRGESAYGVSGSPFRNPNEKPKAALFDSLSPGAQQRDTTTATNPDLDLASGRDLRESRSITPAPAGPAAAEPAPTPAAASPAPSSPQASSPPPPSASPAGASSPAGSSGSSPAPSSAPGPAAPAPGGGPGASSGPVQLGFAGPAEVGVGETFDVQVVIDARGSEVHDAPYHLLFDPSLLEVASVSEGTYFQAAGAQSIFLPSISSGRVLIGHSMVGRGNAPTGSGTLATVRVRALSAGTGQLRFDSATISDRTNLQHATATTPYSVRILQ
jgi:general secretion pathway protein D